MAIIRNELLCAHNPQGVSKEQVVAEAPTLVGLLDQTSEAIVYTPSSPYWEEVRLVFNLTVLTQPLAIVRPTSNAAVSTVVRYCSTNKIPVSIRNAGHDFDGRNLIAGGVVIDMRALDWVEVAEDRDRARRRRRFER